MNDVEFLRKLIGKQICIFFRAGESVHRSVGNVIAVTTNFVSIDDRKLGEQIISIETILKIDFNQKQKEVR